MCLIVDKDEYYDPEEITSMLVKLGFSVEKERDSTSEFAIPKISPVATSLVTKIIRWSNKVYNIAREELEEKYGTEIRTIVNIGVKTGVFRDHELAASGTKKHFFRIVCDKNNLIEGQVKKFPDARINTFWDELSARYPR